MSLSAEKMAVRHLSIGSSDAGAVLGLVEQRSPLRVWQEKRQEIAPEDLSRNWAVRLGVKLEPVVAELFTEETGKTLHRINRTIRHPHLPFLTCNVDRRVVGETALAEIKTAGYWAARSDEWGADGSDVVPFKYAVQAHHQMACMPSVQHVYMPLLVGGQQFRVFRIERDPEIIAMLERLLGEFWERVLSGEPPPPTNLAQAKERWPESIDAPIVADTDVFHAVADLKAARAEEKAAKARADEAAGRIAVFMGEADVLVDTAGRTLLTFRSSPRAGYTVAPTISRPMVFPRGKKA